MRLLIARAHIRTCRGIASLLVIILCGCAESSVKVPRDATPHDSAVRRSIETRLGTIQGQWISRNIVYHKAPLMYPQYMKMKLLVSAEDAASEPHDRELDVFPVSLFGYSPHEGKWELFPDSSPCRIHQAPVNETIRMSCGPMGSCILFEVVLRGNELQLSCEEFQAIMRKSTDIE